ncbi:MAG: spermidine synthase [Planctomycetes bacterium]|nr:spermidine synthase [Planctomycetota bacterium]
MTNFWLEDDGSTPGEQVRIECVRELFRVRSPIQEVRIVETVRYGRALFLDGRTQSAQSDEATYHEALVHPAMLHAPEPPRRVAVLGGGEGAPLREALRHRSVERASMVDIDPLVVEACGRWLPEWSAGAYSDPRAQVVTADAKEWIQGGEPLDAVIADLTDPGEAGPAADLYTPEFFRSVRERLAPGGVGVVQCGWAAVHQVARGFGPVVAALRGLFPLVVPYSIHVPSFAGPWGFVLFARERLPVLDGPATDDRIANRIASPLQAFDGATWEHMRHLPRPLAEALGPAAG